MLFEGWPKSLGILAHRTSEDEGVSNHLKVFRFHETILRRWTKGSLEKIPSLKLTYPLKIGAPWKRKFSEIPIGNQVPKGITKDDIQHFEVEPPWWLGAPEPPEPKQLTYGS